MTGFEAAQDRVFENLNIETQSRFVTLDHSPVKIHLTEVGDQESTDVPVVFVHGTGFFGATFAPLMAHLDDSWLISLDRPGYGLSGDFRYSPQTTRETAVRVLEGLINELGIEHVDLVGHSAGGLWSSVFALARPQLVRRLVLVGGLPVPGTRPPIPFRLFSVPVLRSILTRLQKSNEQGVLNQFEMFGERETIQTYPSLIEAVVAQNRNPRSDDVVLSEFNVALTLRGWRRSARLQEEELTELSQPTLVIWGENDPIGGPTEVRDSVEKISDVRFEAFDAGHFPWLGHPEACADLILEMKE